jgi:hypothetical protein
MHEMAASAYHDIGLIAAPKSRASNAAGLAGVNSGIITRSDGGEAILNCLHLVIPGRSVSCEPGIHSYHREFGFRACAFRRIPE